MAKIQIRRGVFETNSSSTHSITISESSDYEKFVKGQYWWKEGEENEFLPEELARKWNDENVFNDPEKASWCDKDEYTGEYIPDLDYCYVSYEMWKDRHQYFEWYKYDFETRMGERYTAWGYYGHD